VTRHLLDAHMDRCRLWPRAVFAGPMFFVDFTPVKNKQAGGISSLDGRADAMGSYI